MPIRALFFGTPDFAIPTLRVLHEDPAIELCGVVTRPDRPAGRGKQLQPPPVKVLAQERNLEIFQPESLKDPAAVEWIRQRSPDVLVVVAYGAFVPTAVREIPPLGCVNLHPSRLPRYRGAAPIQWTLINGETATANTTMYLADGWDDGDIIYQEEEPVRPRDTAGGLAERLAEKGGRLVLRSLVDIAAGVAPRIPKTGRRPSRPRSRTRTRASIGTVPRGRSTTGSGGSIPIPARSLSARANAGKSCARK